MSSMEIERKQMKSNGEQIIAEFMTEDDDFLRRLHQRLSSLFSDVNKTATLSAEEIRSHLNDLPTRDDPRWLNDFLLATFYDPRWLYGDGFAFLHRGDTALPADTHHNLIALCISCLRHFNRLSQDLPRSATCRPSRRWWW